MSRNAHMKGSEIQRFSLGHLGPHDTYNCKKQIHCVNLQPESIDIYRKIILASVKI